MNAENNREWYEEKITTEEQRKRKIAIECKFRHIKKEDKMNERKKFKELYKKLDEEYVNSNMTMNEYMKKIN